jgi:hypothetical protein
MSSQDLLVVGLKLLGVYFAVLGIAQLGTAVVAVIFAGGFLPLQPFVYLAAAFVLVRMTRPCLIWCQPRDLDSPL